MNFSYSVVYCRAEIYYMNNQYLNTEEVALHKHAMMHIKIISIYLDIDNSQYQ